MINMDKAGIIFLKMIEHKDIREDLEVTDIDKTVTNITIKSVNRMERMPENRVLKTLYLSQGRSRKT